MRAFLVYEARLPHGDAAPGAGGRAAALVEFTGCMRVRLGTPNDEVIEGHRLGRGIPRPALPLARRMGGHQPGPPAGPRGALAGAPALPALLQGPELRVHRPSCHRADGGVLGGTGAPHRCTAPAASLKRIAAEVLGRPGSGFAGSECAAARGGTAGACASPRGSAVFPHVPRGRPVPGPLWKQGMCVGAGAWGGPALEERSGLPPGWPPRRAGEVSHHEAYRLERGGRGGDGPPSDEMSADFTGNPGAAVLWPDARCTEPLAPRHAADRNSRSRLGNGPHLPSPSVSPGAGAHLTP
jgi:hypothetical protein